MTLIIYAHPATGGHCEHILKEVKKSLRAGNEKFETIHLYRENYDPVLHENEHYTRGNYEVSKRNQQFQQKIRKHEHFIFIFPVWWYGPPAILKGFLERVFVSRFGFRYVKGVPVGLLKDKRATVFFTSGAPTIYYKLTGNLPKRNIVKTLGFNGIRANVYQFGRCLKFTEEKKRIISKDIARIFNRKL